MPSNEVTWRRETPDGERVHVCARSQGDTWRFYRRAKRFETWEEIATPSLEDWQTLLDGIRRLGGRRRATPRDEARIVAHIRKAFPHADVE